MTIKKWLSNVYYDDYGTHIWNRENDEQNQLVADVRGWGRIQNIFPDNESAQKFQDEVGEFIAQAIREKVEMATSPISIKEIKEICKEVMDNEPSDATERETGYTIAMRHIFEIIESREQLKKK